MNQLQDGYVVDVPYPTFVHRQAMPVWLTTLTRFQGYPAPDIGRPYRYLELGCAMGIHLHLTAAANPLGHFVGIDFNSQQLLVAKEGVERTGIQNIEFIAADFAQFLAQDIEPFDFIVTHGVWSWISKENQTIMLKIIQKLLKTDGILYCSYMSHPGASHLASIQKLMQEMARNLTGDSAHKAKQSLGLIQQLAKSEMGLFAKVPSLAEELTLLAQDKANYIAHDFLATHWQPQHSADMIRTMGHINLIYVAGAGILENLDQLTLPTEVQQIVQKLPLITLKETVKDIALNTIQRQDVYIKQATLSKADDLWQQCGSITFGLLPKAPAGQNLNKDKKLSSIRDAIQFFEQILSYLAKQDATFDNIYQLLGQSISKQQLSELLLVLMWAGYIHPCQSKQIAAHAEQQTNQWLIEQQLSWQALTKYGTAIEN